MVNENITEKHNKALVLSDKYHQDSFYIVMFLLRQHNISWYGNNNSMRNKYLAKACESPTFPQHLRFDLINHSIHKIANVLKDIDSSEILQYSESSTVKIYLSNRGQKYDLSIKRSEIISSRRQDFGGVVVVDSGKFLILERSVAKRKLGPPAMICNIDVAVEEGKKIFLEEFTKNQAALNHYQELGFDYYKELLTNDNCLFTEWTSSKNFNKPEYNATFDFIEIAKTHQEPTNKYSTRASILFSVEYMAKINHSHIQIKYLNKKNKWIRNTYELPQVFQQKRFTISRDEYFYYYLMTPTQAEKHNA